MKTFLFILLIVVLGWQCSKPVKDDLSGSLEIKGVLYLNDTLKSFATETALRNSQIYLRNIEDSSSQNFLYSAITDTLGNFAFQNLSDKQYKLSVSKEISGVIYRVDTTLLPSMITAPIKLVLYPTATTYNVLTIIARDSASKGLLSDASVCLFHSRLLAQANLCDGSFLSLTTDAFGKTHTTRLSTGWYYVNARDSVGQVDIKAKDSIHITNTTGFHTLTVSLK
jgi:hypothetical protein